MTVHLTQEKYELKVFDLFSKENNKYLMRCNTGQFLNFTMQIVAELTLLPVTLFALRLVAKYCNVGHRINHKRKFFNPIFSGKIFLSTEFQSVDPHSCTKYPFPLVEIPNYHKSLLPFYPLRPSHSMSTFHAWDQIL